MKTLVLSLVLATAALGLHADQAKPEPKAASCCSAKTASCSEKSACTKSAKVVLSPKAAEQLAMK